MLWYKLYTIKHTQYIHLTQYKQLNKQYIQLTYNKHQKNFNVKLMQMLNAVNSS